MRRFVELGLNNNQKHMKVTKELVKQFEEDQKKNGTHTAIYNLLWQVASGIFKDLGITSIKTK